MAGRKDSLLSLGPYFPKALGDEIDYAKSSFIFISSPHSRINKDDIDDIDIPGNLMNLADLIFLLQSMPLGVPDANIHKFLYPEEPELIYSSIRKVVEDKEIENVFIFFQGFGLVESDKLILILNEGLYDKETSKKLDLEVLSRLLDRRKSLNTILFLDCSYSGLAFKDFLLENFVLISACGSGGHAYVTESIAAQGVVSIFSYSIVQVFKDLVSGQYGKNPTIGDLYRFLRLTMSDIIREEKLDIDQVPRLLASNVTLYLKLGVFVKDEFENVYTRKNLKDMIAEGNLTSVLEILRKSELLQDEEQNMVITFMMRNRKIRTSAILDILTEEQITVSQNKLAVKLLTFLDRLKEEYGDDFVIKIS